MFYFLANKKFFKYARIGIYAAGAFLLGLVFYQNVIQFETNSYFIKNDGSFPMPNFYQLPTSRPASEIKMEINFKEDNVDVQNLQAFVGRTHSALLRKRNQMIFEAEKLREIIREGEIHPDYPSGTLMESDGTIYLISEQKARPFSSRAIFNRFGFNSKKIKEVSDEVLNQFELGKVINNDDLKEEDFPADIIIKSGNYFYLTGSKRITPIFTENIIREAWPDYHYIESGSLSESALDEMDCFVIDKRNISCQKNNPAENIPGSEYVVSLQEVSLEKIDYVRVQSVFIPTPEYIRSQLKELFW